MIAAYKKKGWMGLGFCLFASIAAGAAAVKYMSSSSIILSFIMVILIAAFAGYCYGITCFTKGKGYSTLYGVLLVLIPVVLGTALLPTKYAGGLELLLTVSGLLLLPDKHPQPKNAESSGSTLP